jgi:hypothetical protein
MDSNTPVTLSANTTVGTTNTLAPNKVVPLLQALGSAEELASVLAMRLDPITNHEPIPQEKQTTSQTVTGRISGIGDVLQYLLDHIEL